MKDLLCQYPEPNSSETAHLAESFWGNCWTPWSRALIEKLTVPQLLKKFSTFYRTQRFITVFTTVCRLYLASAWQTQSTNCHPVPLRYLLMLSLTLPWSSRWTLSFHISMPKTLHAHPFYPGQTTHPIHLTSLAMTTLTISATICKLNTIT
jgi:hypothetical protein